MPKGFPIILLCGQANSGKDTAASYMTEMGGVAIAFADPLKQILYRVFEVPTENLWGPSKMRSKEFLLKDDFSATRSREVCNSFIEAGAGGLSIDFCEEVNAWVMSLKGLVSARELLTSLGTDLGRKYFPNLWAEYGLSVARKILCGGSRYDKEKGLTRSISGAPKFVVITDGRFANEILTVRSVGGVTIRVLRHDAMATGHISETELNTIPENFYTDNIYNIKGPEALQTQSRQTVNNYIFGLE